MTNTEKLSLKDIIARTRALVIGDMEEVSPNSPFALYLDQLEDDEIDFMYEDEEELYLIIKTDKETISQLRKEADKKLIETKSKIQISNDGKIIIPHILVKVNNSVIYHKPLNLGDYLDQRVLYSLAFSKQFSVLFISMEDGVGFEVDNDFSTDFQAYVEKLDERKYLEKGNYLASSKAFYQEILKLYEAIDSKWEEYQNNTPVVRDTHSNDDDNDWDDLSGEDLVDLLDDLNANLEEPLKQDRNLNAEELFTKLRKIVDEYALYKEKYNKLLRENILLKEVLTPDQMNRLRKKGLKFDLKELKTDSRLF